MVGRMPVAGKKNGEPLSVEDPDGTVERRHRLIPAGHTERSPGQKIVLHIRNREGVSLPNSDPFISFFSHPFAAPTLVFSHPSGRQHNIRRGNFQQN
jgi:hypothetical protein